MQAAVKDLTVEIEGIKKKGAPVAAEEFLAYLNAREALYEKFIHEVLRPQETFNQSIDEDIRKEGRREWLERVLTEGYFEQLIKKQWYSEAAYALYRMDLICTEANLPLLTGGRCDQIRSWHLYDA